MERRSTLQSYQIQDLKDFMKKLLLTETFDAFLLSEASVTTYAAFHLDGSIHPDYFSTDEAETLTTEQCGYVLWKRVRPLFFELMKGKNTPLSFQIVFRLAPVQRRIPASAVRTFLSPGRRGWVVPYFAVRRHTAFLYQRKLSSHLYAGSFPRSRLGCNA